MSYDFIAIGDTVTDEFIELKDVRIDTDRDRGDRGYDEICFRFGDKVEYESAVIIPAVGNAANAAVSAARLGLKAGFITDIGNDDLGKRKLETLEKNDVDCRWVETHQGIPSNHHYVLRSGAERTILVKHQEYKYDLPSDLEPPKWFYFSSIGEHDVSYHFKITDYIKNHPESMLAFQPGTFQIDLGAKKLAPVYEASELLFCNKEEAVRILEKSEKDIHRLLSGLRDLGPRIAVITDGPAGAYASDGEETWQMPMYPDIAPPVDRTGAGDAFSSTLTAALASGGSLEMALSWAPINSMNVVQYVGAQEGLLTRDRIEEYLKNAPDDYKPKKLA